ncbi:MAG: HNH endonuclease, partial [Sphingomonadaceae bacterium]|nr:HNH endonuclease [Sphingomonadaceae bacterium]
RYCALIGVIPFNKKRSYWRSARISHAFESQFSAIDDIIEGDAINNSSEYRLRMSGSYIRDPAVRRRVLDRANGTCEYGGCSTFRTQSGEPYLEAHHVIKLSEQGSDTIGNVIALCPNHHREAHFGDNWQSLQDEFLEILKKVNR